jgi:hypothetical protein
MKNFKHAASIATFLAIAASFATLPVSAKAVNEYSVSHETLTESIITEAGNYIPAGSVAVTMSIDNNTGFSSNTFLLDIANGYEVIVDEDNNPIIETGSGLSGFLTAASAGNDKLCVAVAASNKHRGNGDLFTFYCSVSSDALGAPASIGVFKDTLMQQYSDDKETDSKNNRVGTYINFGDVNGDYFINASDATEVLKAVDINNNNIILCTYLYNYPNNIATYFPDCYGPGNQYCYVAADVYTPPYTGIYYIDEYDAQQILVFAACVGTGSPYTGTGRFGLQFFDLSQLQY